MTDNLDLFALVSRDTQLKRVASTKGGEWAGPCPFCGGSDRLRVWPEHPGGRGQFWCRGCGKQGDAIAYLVDRGEITTKEAAELRRGAPWSGQTSKAEPVPPAPKHSERLTPPPSDWQQAGRDLVAKSQAALWAAEHGAVLAWVRDRGLNDDTIRAAGLGYNTTEHSATWGEAVVWVPPGIVIPWEIGGELWRVNIRRGNRRAGEAKYYSPAGWKNALFGADRLAAGKPAILTEGEFDALVLGQEAGDLIAPVATGSTTGARRPRWIAALALCSLVLVSFDNDDPGAKAAAEWLGWLQNAQRWAPPWGDANAMAQDGADLRRWVQAGLDGAHLDARLDALERAAADTDHRLDLVAARKLAEAREFAQEAQAEGVPCNMAPTWADWLAGVEAELA